VNALNGVFSGLSAASDSLIQNLTLAPFSVPPFRHSTAGIVVKIYSAIATAA
jgi:hypothetical protein